MNKYFKKLTLFYNRMLDGYNLNLDFRNTLIKNKLEHLNDLIEHYPQFFSRYDKKNDQVPFVFVVSQICSFEALDLLIQAHIDGKIDLAFEKIKNNSILNYFANNMFHHDSDKSIHLLLKIKEIQHMIGKTQYNHVIRPSVYEYALDGQKSLDFFKTLLSFDSTTFYHNLNVAKKCIKTSRSDVLELIVKNTPQFISTYQVVLFDVAIKCGDVKSLELLIQAFDPTKDMLQKGLEYANQRHTEPGWLDFFNQQMQKIEIQKEMTYLNERVNEKSSLQGVPKKHRKI